MNTPPSTLAVVLAFAAVYLIWGSTYLAIRVGIETLPPFALAASRFAIAGALLYGWARWRGAKRPTSHQWWKTALIGTLLLCGGNGLVCLAEETVPSGIAALFVATVPIFMVIFERLRFGTTLPLATVLGIACGFLGMVSLVTVDSAGSPAPPLFGALLLIGAALSWSYGSVMAKGDSSLPDSPTITTAMEMIGGSVALGLVATLRGEWSAVKIEAVSAASWVALAYLIVFGSIIAFTAYVWLLHHVSVASASTYAFVNPIVALFLGWWLKSEPLGHSTLLATALIIAGVILIHRSRESRSAESPPTFSPPPAPDTRKVANR